MAPYGLVNNRLLLPPGWRCTAYYYAAHSGLPVTYSYLLELGLRAARAARWLGLRQATVREGPFRVHTWPEWVWVRAAASLAIPARPAGPPPLHPRVAAFYAQRREPPPGYDGGFWSVQGPPEDTQAWLDVYGSADEDAGWREDPYADLPWDGDDIRPYA
jgi:hypothetical protein